MLKFDRERNRVSLGLKQLGEDPWVAIKARYPEGTRVMARVTNPDRLRLLRRAGRRCRRSVHVSEMDWTNKNIHPSKVVQVGGDEVEVMVLDIDEERRRISRASSSASPTRGRLLWPVQQGRPHLRHHQVDHRFRYLHRSGRRHRRSGSPVRHFWNEPGEEAVRRFKKGDELDTVILSVDPERERISTGIKQLEDDPFSNYAAVNDKGSIVRGTVKEVDAKGAIIDLGNDIEATLKASEISRDRVEDARNVLKEGDEVEAKIISIDRKSRVISLSIKSKDVEDEGCDERAAHQAGS